MQKAKNTLLVSLLLCSLMVTGGCNGTTKDAVEKKEENQV